MEFKKKKLVLSLNKSNVLASSMLWKEVVKEASKDHPNVKLKYHLVDTVSIEVIINPEKFDVIVTINMFERAIERVIDKIVEQKIYIQMVVY